MASLSVFSPKDRILILALALAAGGGGAALQNELIPPRPDPYTGSEAQAAYTEQQKFNNDFHSRLVVLEARTERQEELLDKIDAGVRRIELAVEGLPPAEWRERIRELEKQIFKKH